MKFYHVYIEFQEYYKAESKRTECGYFKDLKNAYDFCREIAEECNNKYESYDDFYENMVDFGCADIAQFTVEEIGFMDENG